MTASDSGRPDRQRTLRRDPRVEPCAAGRRPARDVPQARRLPGRGRHRRASRPSPGRSRSSSPLPSSRSYTSWRTRTGSPASRCSTPPGPSPSSSSRSPARRTRRTPTWCAGARRSPTRAAMTSWPAWSGCSATRSACGPSSIEPALDLTRRFVPHAVVSDHARFRQWLRQALAAARETGTATLARARALRLYAYEGRFGDSVAAAEAVAEARAVYDACSEDVRGSDGRDLGVLLDEVRGDWCCGRRGDAAAATAALTHRHPRRRREPGPAPGPDQHAWPISGRGRRHRRRARLEVELAPARPRRAATSAAPSCRDGTRPAACASSARPDEALAAMETTIPAFLTESPLPRLLPVAAEDCAAILVDSAEPPTRPGCGARPRGPATVRRCRWRRAGGRDGRGARTRSRRARAPGGDELVAAARDDDLEDTLRGVVGAATSLTA